MEFSFDPGRDLFYLAFLFFGAALGSFLNRFRRKCNKSFRDRSITIAILFLSGAVASLAVMLILTEATIIAYPALFIIGAVFALLALLAVRFPRTAGFSLIFLAGLGIVWVSYSFFAFPLD
jgi:membrane associated rhomboid family serine protease